MKIGNLSGGDAAGLATTSPPIGGAIAGAATAATRGALLALAGSGPGSGPGTLRKGAGAVGPRRHAEALGALLGRLTRSALCGASAGSAGSSTRAATGGGGALAFLKDPRLSVEEKLARLMVHLSDKYEKQLEQKLQQYAALEGGAAGAGSAKKSGSSGGAGGVASGLTGLLSRAGLGKLLSGGGIEKLVGQVAGPVLAGAATALGMPQLAPALLRAGPLLGNVAAGAVSALTEAGATGCAKGATATSKGTSSAPGGAAPGAAGTSEKALMTEIQILQEKQKEMFTLVSNILRAQHDTKMAVIANVR